MTYIFPTHKKRKLHMSMRGFTLIELMVTAALFITVITIATGALFSAQAINVKLQETQAILDEMNLSVQMISKDIRYSSQFYCSSDPEDSSARISGARSSCAYPSGGTAIFFRPSIALSGTTDASKDRAVYFISNNTLYKTEYPFGGVSQTYPITSQDIKVNTFEVYVSGAESSPANLNQPLITFTITGDTVPRALNVKKVRFSLQQSVSPRGLDN